MGEIVVPEIFAATAGAYIVGPEIPMINNANDVMTNWNSSLTLSTSADYVYDTCSAGHECRPDMLQIFMGKWITYCRRCACKIIMQDIPSTLPRAKIKGLLLALMDKNQNVDLSDFNDIVAALEEEEKRLQAVRAQVNLIQHLVRQRHDLGSSPAEQSVEHQPSECDALGSQASFVVPVETGDTGGMATTS